MKVKIENTWKQKVSSYKKVRVTTEMIATMIEQTGMKTFLFLLATAKVIKHSTLIITDIFSSIVNKFLLMLSAKL